MENMDELHSALLKADAAGNAADAKVLADHIRSLSAPEPTPQQPPQRDVLGDIGHQLGLTGRAAVTGLTGLPAMLGDAANTGINYATQGINSIAGTNIPKMKMPSEVIQNKMNDLGVSQPETPTEARNQTIASSLMSASPSIGLGKMLAGTTKPVAQGIGAALQERPAMQMIASGGAGLGGHLAAENGGGMAAQLAASLLGGIGGAGLSSGVTSAMRGLGAPSQATLIADALKNYESNAASNVKPRFKLNADGTSTEIPATPKPITFENPIVPEDGVKLSSDKQIGNIETMKKIGLNDQRPSAISGDKFAAGQEYENGKLNNPIGEVARAQLSKEQDALKGYASQLIDNTGAKIGTPEAAGQGIKNPLQGLSDHLDAQTKNVYDIAHADSAGLPVVKLNSLDDMLNINSNFDSKSENGALRRGIRSYMKEQEISKDGQMQPITVRTAEGLRKYLNNEWTPQNSGLIGKIKQSLDSDVTQQTSTDAYQQARSLHAKRIETLDNPNGISALLSDKGVNQAIPDEQVGNRIVGMPTSQFSHVLDTLKGLPDHLQESGQNAISEIKAAFAKRIYQAGDSGGTQNGPSVWNAAKVTKELKAHQTKMEMLFSPEEMNDWNTLHDAGHILQTPMAYKGAAAQGYNYLQSGVLGGLPAAGAGLGAMLGGPMGSVVGTMTGAGLSKAAKSTIDTSMAAKYAEILKNPVPQFSK